MITPDEAKGQWGLVSMVAFSAMQVDECINSGQLEDAIMAMCPHADRVARVELLRAFVDLVCAAKAVNLG